MPLFFLYIGNKGDKLAEFDFRLKPGILIAATPLAIDGNHIERLERTKALIRLTKEQYDTLSKMPSTTERIIWYKELLDKEKKIEEAKNEIITQRMDNEIIKEAQIRVKEDNAKIADKLKHERNVKEKLKGKIPEIVTGKKI